MAVVLRELYTAMLIEKLRASQGWLGKLKDESGLVGNNVIHLNEVGADPDVLINNTVYPIATAQREDNDIPISLNKYDTTNTRITQDELYGLPYDKQGSVIAQHKSALEEKMGAHGLYTIAPPLATTTMPILVTTGDADSTGRLRLTEADLITMGQAFDDAKIPAEGRVLILNSQHKADLLLSSLGKYIATQIQTVATGALLPSLFGFEIGFSLTPPVYDLSTKKRKAFGAVSADVDTKGSVAFSAADCFRAYGTVQMFYKDAVLDPENRSSTAGFRQWGIACPYTRRSQAAIISGKRV